MLILKHKVPPALVLPERVDDLLAHLKSQGAHWFSARPDHVSFDDTASDAVLSLRSMSTGAVAEKTRPNKLNSRISDGDGLQFTENTHCGFMLPDMQMDPGNWSCALRLKAPTASARTLFTLKPENTENYVFLQQVMGEFILKDQLATAEITENPDIQTGPLLVIAGLSAGRLWLRAQSREVQTSASTEWALEGPYTLFLGCRSNKARLLKTLGQFQLFDAVFWPDRNVLDPGYSMTLEALDDPALWRARP